MEGTGAADTDDRVRALRRGAVWFGALPLAYGSLLFWLFRGTRAEGLALLGLAWLGVGTLLVFAGLWCYFRAGGRRRLILLLLLANFPVAAVCAVAGADLLLSWEVSVKNESGGTLSDVRLHYPGGERALDSLDPGERIAAFIRPRGDGALRLTWRTEEGEGEVMLKDYVTHNSGGGVNVAIGPGGRPRFALERPRARGLTVP